MPTPSPAPRLPAGERLRRAGVTAWSIIGILILGAISVWALLRIRIIFPPLVLALLIIYLLNPIISRLEHRRVPRLWGTFLAYIVVFGTMTLLIIAISPYVADQFETFSEDAPEFRLKLASFTEDAVGWVEDRAGVDIDTSQVSCLLGVEGNDAADAPTAERCDEVTRDLRGRIAGSADRLTELGFGVLEGLLIFVLSPLLALYLLIDLPRLQRDLANLIPPSHRDEFVEVGSKIGRTVGGFFRGQLFVAMTVGVLSSIGFAIVGLDFWLVIGAIAGFTNLIPLVGPFIGGSLGFLVGTVTEGVATGFKAVIVAVVVQQIDNHIISPNVMKRAVQIHPVAVMLSLLAGGALAGFWGVLLGVPAVAVMKLVLSHVWQTRVLQMPDDPRTEPTVGEQPPVEDPAEKPTPSDT